MWVLGPGFLNVNVIMSNAYVSSKFIFNANLAHTHTMAVVQWQLGKEEMLRRGEKMPGQDCLRVYQVMVVHVTVIALELWTKHYIILFTMLHHKH